MHTSRFRAAVSAAMSSASELGLRVEDAIVLQASNKLAVRLLPCNVLARVADVTDSDKQLADAKFEVELAQLLAESESPVAALEPRAEPRVYVRDGFAITLWTYYESVPPQDVAPAEYARALERLHAGMRRIRIAAPHFTDRVAEAQSLVASRDRTPELPQAQRRLLSNSLLSLIRAIGDRGAPEQLLHGEPHPGNLLRTKKGLLFIDLETCCRGPIEFDVAHAGSPWFPDSVSEHYSGLDQQLLRECHVLMLAMITAWRWDRDDKLPNGRRLAVDWINELQSALERYGLDIAR